MKDDCLGQLSSVHQHPFGILDANIPIAQYTPLDLSSGNTALGQVDITDPDICQAYINTHLRIRSAKVAYGGYLEQRNLYGNNPNFTGAEQRNIHLGVDFWASAGTKVRVPLEGKVHSFKNNAAKGDYGPTIILEHRIEGNTFYSLYGHLSLASLRGLSRGEFFSRGAVLGTLGTPDINVHYAPHLHFQLILDLGRYEGDYPGVCAIADLEHYKTNCPNPMLLLGW